MHRVVIIGGGFGGVYTAMALRRAPVDITLVDRNNYHLFQPLLYQVATGSLSPADISRPLRDTFKKSPNISVILGEAVDFDLDRNRLALRDRELEYDSLVVAAGSSQFYFGNNQWAEYAPPLKGIENAVIIRNRILSAFERAELESDPEAVRRLLTFVIIGAGPTGVELAGALAEIARDTLKRNFRKIDPAGARILLIDASSRVLPLYPEVLSAKAERSLDKLGVTVKKGMMVGGIEGDCITYTDNGEEKELHAGTILWAAGVKASPLAGKLAAASGAEADKTGRLKVGPNLTLPGHDNVFVAGDMACYENPGGEQLPGLATVAMQQGGHVAKVIRGRLAGRREPEKFVYRDLGSMATIGRNMAVADLGKIKINGALAWLAWAIIHVMYIMQPDKRLTIVIQWIWYYFTRNRTARIITNTNYFKNE